MRARDLQNRIARGEVPAKAVGQAASPLAGASALVSSAWTLDATIAGPGPALMKLMSQEGVSDVLVNGISVWVDRRGRMERAQVEFSSPAQVRELAVRMAATAGTRLDEAMPIADGTLPDGTRLHAVLSPPAVGGPLISLRTKRRKSFTLEELRQNGTCTEPMFDAIVGLVEARANVLLSGATGTGKTTLLSAILSKVDAGQRIICIEEVPELSPTHPHAVTMCQRGANVQGEGEVSLADLVRAAMRMRPDRLVLGECRGAEVRDVLMAFNTGHEGGWATIHANTAADVPARLVALGALAGMTDSTVHAQAAAALDAIIHVERRADGKRAVAQIAVVEPGTPVRVLPALTLAGRGPGFAALQARLQAGGVSGLGSALMTTDMATPGGVV
ncbi:TadA family conjugal transfer-associated ATPase [Gleimia europaea]|uniref:TadA family conjugal transfer-associated ATPase n=1 Tax=Gleimia europaea TaxID=66228 RepID=UPI002781D74E|nr:TadA family conjugal transfer-associated ATPase [Gleimia europaea]MDP9833546.1 pilus assembly protein CpaF [Gleimia europaea]